MGSHLAMYGMLSTSSWWNLDTLLGTCKKMPDLEEEKHGMCRQIRIPHKPRMPLQYRHSVWYLRRISVHTKKEIVYLTCILYEAAYVSWVDLSCASTLSFPGERLLSSEWGLSFFPLLLATQLLSNIRERWKNSSQTASQSFHAAQEAWGSSNSNPFQLLKVVLPGKGCAGHQWPSVKVSGISQVLLGVRISWGDFETLMTGVHSI